jgi:hypothetical protein
VEVCTYIYKPQRILDFTKIKSAGRKERNTSSNNIRVYEPSQTDTTKPPFKVSSESRGFEY